MEKGRAIGGILCISLVVLFTACASPPRRCYPPAVRSCPPTQRSYEVFAERYYPLPSAEGFVEEGVASWYGPNFDGKITACGEVYDMYEATAAHKTLPMHTYVRVCNLENGRETIVRINDRGPFVKGRVVDLSLAAAKEIDMYDNGTAQVRIEALGTPTEVYEDGRWVKRFIQTKDYRAGDFWIQVGAFSIQDNADRLRASLMQNFDQVNVETYDRGDALFYRVQVFASTNLDKARDVEREFERQGFPNAFIVAR